MEIVWIGHKCWLYNFTNDFLCSLLLLLVILFFRVGGGDHFDFGDNNNITMNISNNYKCFNNIYSILGSGNLSLFVSIISSSLLLSPFSHLILLFCLFRKLKNIIGCSFYSQPYNHMGPSLVSSYIQLFLCNSDL